MNGKKITKSGGVGITGLLQVAFIVLKLCGVINWNWWWVLCPAWGSIVLAILFLAIYLVLATLAEKL